MQISLGVIGFGKMAQALITPLIDKKQFSAQEIFGVVGLESSVNKVLDTFDNQLRVSVAGTTEALEVWKAPIKILSVKPQQLTNIEEKSYEGNCWDKEKPLIISLLAGVTLKKLQEVFPNHLCVRVVANTPIMVGKGITGLAWGNDIGKKEKAIVKKIFHPVSDIYELPERDLDAFLALTSSGPAFISVIIEALSDGAVAAGLSRGFAKVLTTKLLAGTVALIEEQQLHPAELKDLVSSPRGTTITALRHLEMTGLRSALIESVVLAAERSCELGELD